MTSGSLPTPGAFAPLAPPPAAPAVSAGPTATPSAPPAPPTKTAPPLAMVLDDLVRTVFGTHGALLASVDGFAIAKSSSMPNEAAHAAILAAGMGLAHQLAGLGGGTELRQLVVDHNDGLLLLWPIGEQRVLALITERTVNQSDLRRFVQSTAHWLAGEKS